jgi:Tfp pilus assembly protein PilP
MKLKTGILALGVMLGTAWAQNPDVIQNTRDTLQNVQKKQAIDQNAALAAAGQAIKAPAASQPSAAKPTPNKPATNNSAAVPTPSRPAAAPAAKAAVSSPANASKPAVNNPPEAPKARAKKTTPNKHAKTLVAVKQPSQPKKSVAVEDKKVPVESKKEPREYSAAGRRDPFISPVVSHMEGGSGCSSGKRCLAVDQIILTGIVKSDAGMIAVVVNSLNKAYFLRENDPVFNGYVVKITGDSIIFSQTIQDKLGKPFTREVTKKIATPAV